MDSEDTPEFPHAEPTLVALSEYLTDANLSLEADSQLAEFVAEFTAAMAPLTEYSRPEPLDRPFEWAGSIGEEATDSDTGEAAKGDRLGAFVTYCDIRHREGGILAGFDVAIKDNIAVGGIPMTCGSPTMRDHRPRTDASVVERLLDAGGRIIGKTTMNEFAMGGDKETFRFTLPRNPHDSAHRPGGSSAGSAIAVANGDVDVALGTDTAASVRCPAAYCGVVGLKPSKGAVSHHGVFQFAKTLDAVGVLARNVADATRTFEVIAGTDPQDEYTDPLHHLEDADFDIADHEGGDGTHSDGYALSETDTGFTDTTIGVPREMLAAGPTVDHHFTASLDTLADAGATVRDVSIPNISLALPAWAAIACTEFGAYLDSGAQNYWLDGGSGVIDTNTVKEALTGDTTDLNRTLQSVLVVSKHLAALDKGFYEQARHARRSVIDGFSKVFEDIDCLVTPTMPQVAPRWDDTDTESSLFESVANTAPCNVAGLPAVSVPCGRGSDGDLPVGLQFVGPRYSERELLRVAAIWEAISSYTVAEEGT